MPSDCSRLWVRVLIRQEARTDTEMLLIGAELEAKVLQQSRDEYSLVMAERIFQRLTTAQQQGQVLFPNLVNYKLLDPPENLQRLLQQVQVSPAPTVTPVTNTNAQVSNVSQSHVSHEHVEMMEW